MRARTWVLFIYYFESAPSSRNRHTAETPRRLIPLFYRTVRFLPDRVYSMVRCARTDWTVHISESGKFRIFDAAPPRRRVPLCRID